MKCKHSLCTVFQGNLWVCDSGHDPLNCHVLVALFVYRALDGTYRYELKLTKAFVYYDQIELVS